MATVGTERFSTTSTISPFGSTLRTVRAANEVFEAVTGFCGAADAVARGAAGRAASLVCVAAAGFGAFGPGTNHPTVACSGTR